MAEDTCQATHPLKQGEAQEWAQQKGGGIHWCDLPAGHDLHHVCCRCGSAWEDDR